MAKRDWVPTDDEVNQAKSVLERAYRSWVNDLAEELLFEAFAEDWDHDELTDAVNERCDSGLIYTHDQWTALFVSRNTDEAWDQLRDMGSADAREAPPVAPWAVLTYTQDVNEALNSSLLEAIQEHGGRGDDLINWLIEEHGGQDFNLSKGGEEVHLWLIGDIDDVSFGALVVTGDNHEHEFIARGLDRSSLKVMLDLILDLGGDYKAERVRKFIRDASGVR